MTVRHADPDIDGAACAFIYAPYVVETAISFELEPPSAEQMAERIRSSHLWLVAEDGGRVLGYAYGGQHRSRAAYDRTVEVSAYVDREAHRNGTGRALYAELLDQLRERGFRLAVAGITLPNDASVGFHEALGFDRVGVYRNVGFKFDAWHDVGWWQLDLWATGNGPALP